MLEARGGCGFSKVICGLNRIFFVVFLNVSPFSKFVFSFIF